MPTALKAEAKPAATGAAAHTVGVPAQGGRIARHIDGAGVPTLGAPDAPAPVGIKKDVGGLQLVGHDGGSPLLPLRCWDGVWSPYRHGGAAP